MKSGWVEVTHSVIWPSESSLDHITEWVGRGCFPERQQCRCINFKSYFILDSTSISQNSKHESYRYCSSISKNFESSQLELRRESYAQKPKQRRTYTHSILWPSWCSYIKFKPDFSLDSVSICNTPNFFGVLYLRILGIYFSFSHHNYQYTTHNSKKFQFHLLSLLNPIIE